MNLEQQYETSKLKINFKTVFLFNKNLKVCRFNVKFLYPQKIFCAQPRKVELVLVLQLP